ncbi:inhibitor of growth protein 5 [Nematocida minor]|uniref:inhibitor of growth protein 5 n=1 Tax=Nematocida minor TaxID=1912983 RepID=UPI00221FF3EF|nr:inhibitor of growth protein 5 [Nematocida minor]KAI5190693.1 inhibitor of growth protein 5 [Nematocida minor]
MLIQEYLNIMEEAPKEVQKAIIQLTELEHSVSSEKKELDREIERIHTILEEDYTTKGEEKDAIDRQLRIINRCYLKLLDTDKRKLALVTSLKNQLESTKETMKASSYEFKEGISKSCLSIKLKKILSLLDYKIEEDNKEEEILCCTCKRPSKGEMIVCDNPECPIEWFHTACVGIKGIPKKKWMCNLCSKNE